MDAERASSKRFRKQPPLACELSPGIPALVQPFGHSDSSCSDPVLCADVVTQRQRVFATVIVDIVFCQGKAVTPHPTDVEPIALADHGYFFVGARHVGTAGKQLSEGGMYVEYYKPLEQSHATPVVMFHGAGQTGTNYISTPDGRRGWLHDFLRAGYSVYIADQPERGRSGHARQRLEGGHLTVDDATKIENFFTAPRKNSLWPQARHHTQWPGTGEVGDPAFDQFHASQVDGLSDRSEIERLNQHAGTALLDKIGPAILLTHSQSGPFGWLVADSRPALVKAILALEPNGPPFFDVQFTGQQNWYAHNEQQLARPYGITRATMTFDPPLYGSEPLDGALQPPSPNQEHVTGYLQAEPARKLPNLQNIPILIMIAQASYHATYDHLTSEFLTQAGVDNELVYLEQQGLSGNGHMVMLEKNNHQVADFMLDWLQTHREASHHEH